jgi:hypothetical protein
MGKKTPEQILNKIAEDYESYDGELMIIAKQSALIQAMTEYGNQQWNAALEKSADEALVKITYKDNGTSVEFGAYENETIEAEVDKQSILNLKK